MIRIATNDDRDLVRTLWDEFNGEIPDVSWHEEDVDEDFANVEQALREGGVLVADDVGIAAVLDRGPAVCELYFLHVRPNARRQGVAAALMREVARLVRERGRSYVELDVLASNAAARSVYERWGFDPIALRLAAGLDDIEQRAAEHSDGPTYGAVHVQTDDIDSVHRYAAKFLRFEPDVEQFGDWVRVRSDATDADPARLKALAKELSYTSASVVLALGVEQGEVVRYNLYDRGSDIDEYLSVPEYYGELPPGDVIALGANPTVVARLTNADAARVRAVARTAASPKELPPAEELYATIAETMGVTV